MPRYGAVMVTGSKRFDKKAIVSSVLDSIHSYSPINLLVNGGRRGAERLSVEWAVKNIPGRITTYGANMYGYRNSTIADQIVRIDKKMMFIVMDDDYDIEDLIVKAKERNHDVRRVVSSSHSWWME